MLIITYRLSAGNGLTVSVCITQRARASRILPVPGKSAVVFSHPGLPPVWWLLVILGEILARARDAKTAQAFFPVASKFLENRFFDHQR